jgi:ABC-type transport system involved in multi-copper enzyme maturation permease subunit
MTIREKGYHRWEGELKRTGLQWLPMFFNGIKTVFKKKYSKVLFSLALSPFLIFLGGIYVSTRPELQMLKELVKMLKDEAAYFNIFATNGFTVFCLVVLSIFFGAELISGDIKFNSFPLYFSRPLNRRDYIFGKFSILLFYFLLFTLAPGLLLYIFKMIFTGKVAIDFTVLLALFIVPVLISLYIATITLMVSAFSGNGRYVKIIIFVLYFLSEPIARLMVEISNSSYFLMISLKYNIEQMGTFFFNVDPKYSYPAWLSAAVIIVTCAAAYYVLYKRIGKSEAQIENGN